jgi:hypothetical protein
VNDFVRVRTALRRAGAIALALVLVISTAASALAATRGGPARHGATPQAPIDQSGLQFTAFRSLGLPIVPGEDFYLNLWRSVDVGPTHWAEVVAGSPVDLGSATWTFNGTVSGVNTYVANLLITNPTQGTHTYQAIFDATDTLDALTLNLEVAVEPVPMTVTIVNTTVPVRAHHPVSLAADITGEGTGQPITGNVEWRNADADTVIDTIPVGSYLTIDSPTAGVHHFVASYSGDTTHATATSAVFALTVGPDTVDASGVGVKYSTFYPVKDGYRDYDYIRGKRNEPLSVAIRIYGPTGSVVRSASMGRASGTYSYTWNGRTSGGTVLAAGKYKVVQTLTDAYNTKKAYTNYVYLSHKKLVSHTTYVYRKGSSLSAAGSGDGGSVAVSTSTGVARLRAGSGGWAIGGWQLTLPSATVYNSISFGVYAKAFLGVPPTYIAMQNFNTCARSSLWSDTCFDRWRTIGSGSGSLAWYSTSGSVTRNRSGVYVRGLVEVLQGTTYVYKVRVKVTYQRLE